MRAEFDDTLVTGNEMIDAQHKELIDKINQLLEACEGEGSQAKVKAVKMLDYLMDYTEFHFTAEEKLQEEIGYPGLAKHIEKHNELRRTVKELQEMLEEEQAPSDIFVKQVEKNVVAWLYDHIKGFDRSVAEFKHLRSNPELL